MSISDIIGEGLKVHKLVTGRQALEEAFKLKEVLWDGIGIRSLKKGEVS